MFSKDVLDMRLHVVNLSYEVNTVLFVSRPTCVFVVLCECPCSAEDNRDRDLEKNLFVPVDQRPHPNPP